MKDADDGRIYSPESTDGRPAWRNRLELWSVAICGLLLAGLAYTGWSALTRPVMPCRTMVAISQTCIPFGCTKTHINERGEDTGECG